jgi:hypothetical protein
MKIVVATLIHFIYPLIGVQLYLWLYQRMKAGNLESPPVIPYFILFFTYGGFFGIILTVLFWYWSGMASLFTAYLLILAPIVMLITASQLFQKRKLSPYHSSAFVASISYILVIGVVWFGIIYLKVTKP